MKKVGLLLILSSLIVACTSGKKPDLSKDLQRQHQENLRKYDSMHPGELTEAQKRERDRLAGFVGDQPVFHQNDSAIGTVEVKEIQALPEKTSSDKKRKD